MAINLGTGAIDKLYLGATEITKAYLGATEIYSAGGVTNDAFELTVETTAANETFLLPMQSVTSIDIDWGDGTVDTGITTDNPTHVYATASTHAISVTGTAGTVNFSFSGSQGKLRTVTNLGALGWTSFNGAFRGCSNMTSFNAGDCDASNVTVMQAMFRECALMSSINLSTIISPLNRFTNSMFLGCTSLTVLDLSTFNTDSLRFAGSMFKECTLLTDVIGVENFNIEGVTALSDFMTGFALPTARYDDLLVNWEAQTVNPNLVVTFGNSTYTAGGAAEAARTSLINGDGWTITDGGSV